MASFGVLGFHGIEEVAMAAGSGLGGLYRAMASGGMLRQSRSNCAAFLAFSRCSSASCSSCASLPSTSQATFDSFRTSSSSSSRGVFGCGSGSVADECEDAGLTSDRASIEAIGRAGWCCMTHWTERLCTNFTQTNEMRKSLSTSFGHQSLDTLRGHKTRAVPRGWKIDPTETSSFAANGVKLVSKHSFLQWPRDQNGPVWFARSRDSPTMQSQGIRSLSASATAEEHRRGRREFTASDLQMEHTEEEDLDYYMKSRYDQESLNSNETESETESESESEEELSAEPVQGEEPAEDLLWKLKANDKGKFDNVVAVLGDPRVLAAAHERLNERRRNWTLASNELEVSHVPKENKLLRSREIDYNWFKEAAYQLRTGSYSFKPVKRLDIARRGRGEARQWVFVRPKDQVIQEAIRGILEKIYNPIFSVHDSGFRPGTSVHSALKSVKYGWKGISWFLQFDVRITDHNSVQKRLLKLLAVHIEDEVFLDALKQMFKVGTIWIDTNAEEDKPEGSVLSPMLGNIYFHHLDLEISRIKEEIRSGSQA